MQRGYVKLWRKSIDGGWLSNHKLWAFWCWCLIKASHKEYDLVVGCQKVHLMPGDFVFGRKAASKELRISEQSIRTILDFLKTSQNLTIKTTNKFSVISIVNWETYQSQDNESNQQINQPLTNKPTNINQPLTNNQPTEIYDCINILNEFTDCAKIDTNKSTSKSIKSNHKQECINKNNKNIYSDDFESFWKAYPNKKEKQDAFKKWQKLNGQRPAIEIILNAIKKQIEWRATAQVGEFRPEWKHPSTWLSKWCWDDECKKSEVKNVTTFKKPYRTERDAINQDAGADADEIARKYYEKIAAANREPEKNAG